jgi:hypothetical protein
MLRHMPLALRLTWPLVCAVILVACNPANPPNPPQNELDVLFKAGKYEEFIAKVQATDPGRQDRSLDARMQQAIQKVRVAQCVKDKDALLSKLRELENQGAYSELPKLRPLPRHRP